MQIDVRILELLASKICHDLVSPVGAINNGVELVSDVGGDVVDEAMQLIGNSAVQASRRLRLFRLAYGRAGSEANVTFKDMREVLDAHVEGSKIKLSWDPSLSTTRFINVTAALKMLMNVALLAEECLVYGGAMTIKPSTEGAQIEISGRGAALNASLQAALDGSMPIEEVGPRTVHAYVTGAFLRHFSFRCQCMPAGDDRVVFELNQALGG